MCVWAISMQMLDCMKMHTRLKHWDWAIKPATFQDIILGLIPDAGKKKTKPGRKVTYMNGKPNIVIRNLNVCCSMQRWTIRSYWTTFPPIWVAWHHNSATSSVVAEGKLDVKMSGYNLGWYTIYPRKGTSKVFPIKSAWYCDSCYLFRSPKESWTWKSVDVVCTGWSHVCPRNGTFKRFFDLSLAPIMCWTRYIEFCIYVFICQLCIWSRLF